MRRKKVKNLALPLGSVLISLIIGMTVVIAFRYPWVSLKPAMPGDNQQQADAAAVGERSAASVADRTSSAGLSGVSGTADAFKKKPLSPNHGNNGGRYAYSIQGMDGGENTLSAFKGRRYGSAQTIQSSETRGESSPPADPGSMRWKSLANRSTDYVLENDHSESVELLDGAPGLDEFDRNDNDASNYKVSISRDFISRGLDASEIDVILTLSVGDNPPNGLLIKEYIPEEWDIQQSDPAYENFNPSSSEIKWLFIGADVGSMEISYKIVKRESAASNASFHGLFLYNDPAGEHVTMQIEGGQEIEVF